MTAITFGGKPIQSAAKQDSARPATPRRHAPPPIDKGAASRVVLFMRLVAMSLEARRDLAQAVESLREIDTDALEDPALQDHPRRPAMVALYNDCVDAERLAVQRIAELNVSLSRQWDQISATDKNRYGLTDIVGENDPDADIHLRLWCDVGLARLVPFPEDWTVPTDLAHRALDPSIEVREYSADELMNSPVPPF